MRNRFNNCPRVCIIIATMIMKVNRQRLSNQIYDILKEMITAYRFSPGTRINVEQIAKEVDASRTRIVPR